MSQDTKGRTMIGTVAPVIPRSVPPVTGQLPVQTAVPPQPASTVAPMPPSGAIPPAAPQGFMPPMAPQGSMPPMAHPRPVTATGPQQPTIVPAAPAAMPPLAHPRPVRPSPADDRTHARPHAGGLAAARGTAELHAADGATGREAVRAHE